MDDTREVLREWLDGLFRRFSWKCLADHQAGIVWFTAWHCTACKNRGISIKQYQSVVRVSLMEYTRAGITWKPPSHCSSHFDLADPRLFDKLEAEIARQVREAGCSSPRPYSSPVQVA